MGILKFIKDIFKEQEKEESVKEKIAFSGLDEFIDKKLKEIEEKEKETKSKIKEKIMVFSKEINENIKILNEVDIESKEKNEKIKSTVYEGRKKYIESLERFLKNTEDTINDLEKLNLEKVIGNINSAFVRLNESSGKSYERATILIGKEMGNIRDLLKKFSNELIILFDPGRDLILTSKKFYSIKSMLDEAKNSEKETSNLNKEIEKIEEEIKKKLKEEKEIYDKIEKIKTSPEYAENRKREEDIQNKEKEIEKSISELRSIIDFKSLSSFFHIFENKMETVKLYRDNFAEEFNKDDGTRILSLLDESKLNTKENENKVKKIKEMKEYIKTEKMKIKKDKTEEFSSEAEKLKDEIKDMTKEKEWKENSREKLKNTKEENTKSIKKKLEQLNIDMEG